MSRYVTLLIFIFSFCFAANAQARKLALLVGVDEYVNVPSLKCCVNDMKALKKALMKIGFEEDDIHVLVTGGAYRNFPTKKNIEKQISQIVINAQPSDMVFLAFSGHGAQDGKNVYFCPPDVETDDLKGTCVSINKVMDILANKCKAKFKWMVVDACRNDPTRGAKGIGGKGLQVIPTPPAGIALFQSCAEGEESWEDRESGNGYFTKNFAAALSGSADTDHDGKLTLFEVCKWTTSQTKEQVKNSQNKSQRPYFSGSVSDFTLYEDLNLPKAKALTAEARAAVKAEKYALAIKKYDEAIALYPASTQLKHERAMAQRLLDLANRKPDPDDPTIDWDDDDEPDDDGEYPNIPVVPDSDPAEENPDIQDGLEDFKNNDIEGALAKFEQARQFHPEFSPAELMLAKLALQIDPQKNGATARMLIERCIKDNPTDPEAYIFLGDYNINNGSVTEADVCFLRAGVLLKNFQGNAQRKNAMIRQFNAGMAMVYERRGKFNEAKMYLEINLKNNPKNVAAIQQLARVLLNMDKPDEAIRQLEKAKSIQSEILTPEAVVAMFYQQKGDKNMALTYMEKALDKAPKDVNTLLAASQWFQQNNNIDTAIKYADAALRIDSSSEDALINRGSLALIKKDYARAIDLYNRVLDQSPNNFAASNNIALALCETGKPDDLKRAVEYAGVNAQRFGRQPETFSTLGYVLFKNGSVDEALRSLQQSLQLSGGRMSPDTAYYLCCALNAKGNADGIKQAKEIITKTLENAKTFNMRAEAMKLKAELDKK